MVICQRRWTSVDGRTGNRLYLWCPACDQPHGVELETGPVWNWDGNEEAPTISPSIKVDGVQWAAGNIFHKSKHRVDPGQNTICHSYVRQGHWEFLPDCTHSMAGTIVPLPEIPARLIGLQ